MPAKITMFLGSLDHSPSEQLIDLEQWHTTVLILSEGGEHWDLAREVAKTLGLNNDALKKWSSRSRYKTKDYELKFEQTLFGRIDSYPVHVRAISAQGKAIKSCLSYIQSELHIQNSVTSIIRNNKPYLQFKFNRACLAENGLLLNGPEVTFELHERQGIPLIFICHFLLRMHHEILSIVQKEHPNIEWIDWQISPNKFPGDTNGPMSRIFHAIMSAATHVPLVNGTMRILTYNESQGDLGSALADNIAGLLANKLARAEKRVGPRDIYQRFEWEVLEPS